MKFYYLLIIFLLISSCKNKNIHKSPDTNHGRGKLQSASAGYDTNGDKKYKKAFEKFKNKKYNEAYRDFIKLIQKYPDDLELNYHIGFIAAKSNNFPVAKKYLLKTISIDKTKWETYRELAALYKSAYKYKEALKWVKKVFKYEQNDPLSNFIMAYLSNKLEKNDNANIYYERAIRATSTYMLAYIHYGEFYFSRKKYAKAEKIWLEGLKKRYSTTIAQRLGSLYIKTKKYNKAINIYNELLLKYKNNVEPYFHIGKIYELQNNIIKAIEFYQKALSLNPSYNTPKIALAEIYDKQKKYDKALKIYRELNEKLIDKTTFYLYKQAVILKKQKKRNEYLKIIKKLKSNTLRQSKDYLKLLSKIH